MVALFSRSLQGVARRHLAVIVALDSCEVCIRLPLPTSYVVCWSFSMVTCVNRAVLPGSSVPRTAV